MKRCAIYTRKSTDEGLDQSFNSLDAQREACEAFIVSQRHEGWTQVKKAYDDGGYSGGSLERPALQRLLADIRNGLLDIIVVYKIDRLTRSLADFAKMVEVFDEKGVYFVSVTQQFNTTTSMGRLTLNVLLSFAQFEREVTAERIRDKIAASKKKGLWMGGPTPLGYDIESKRMAINPQEAEQVRRLFKAYLELPSIRALAIWANDNGIKTKLRRASDGGIRSGGRPFSRGNLHALLKYHAYVGEVAHKGAVYPGNHDAIVSRELWDQVQAKLSATGTKGRSRKGAPPSLPLTGLVFDETGDRLTPVHATKTGRRYYYYVSSRLQQNTSPDPSAWRLPAPVLERAVVKGVASFLENDRAVQEVLGENTQATHLLMHGLKLAGELVDRIQQSHMSESWQAIRSLIERIELISDRMTIQLRITALLSLLGQTAAQSNGESQTHPVIVPFAVKRRGVEKRLVLGDDKQSPAAVEPVLLRTIAEARAWFEDLKTGTVTSINEIAVRDGIPASEVSRQLPLAFLSPSIVEAILTGHQPVSLTAKALKRHSDIPLAWAEQSRLLGFTSN